MSARTEALVEASKIARQVSADLRIKGQVLYVESRQMRRAGERREADHLDRRAWGRFDESYGAQAAAERLSIAALTSSHEDADR